MAKEQEKLCLVEILHDIQNFIQKDFSQEEQDMVHDLAVILSNWGIYDLKDLENRLGKVE
jgi:hypothetical protein